MNTNRTVMRKATRIMEKLRRSNLREAMRPQGHRLISPAEYFGWAAKYNRYARRLRAGRKTK